MAKFSTLKTRLTNPVLFSVRCKNQVRQLKVTQFFFFFVVERNHAHWSYTSVLDVTLFLGSCALAVQLERGSKVCPN